MIVIGLDGATWKIIKPNLEQLPNIKKLMEEGKHTTLNLTSDPWSVPVWTSMFSGKSAKEHNHYKFVNNGNLAVREDINAEFIWEVMSSDHNTAALNIPIILPPLNFNCKFDSVGHGLPENEEEWNEELETLTEKAKEVLSNKPDLLCVVYGFLDRVQHYLWGSDDLIKWYKKVDEKIGELIKFDDKIIIVSDHGFCAMGESSIPTVKQPESFAREVKGEHDTDAILITKNINQEIKKPEDVFFAIQNELKGDSIGS